MKKTLCFILTLLTFGTLAGVPTSFSQDTEPENVVRLIYFRPRDRQYRPDRVVALGELITGVQKFYADEMKRHGYDRKTFALETNAAGAPLVHHVLGEFTDSYYHTHTFEKTWEELKEQFDAPKAIYLVMIDLSSETIGTSHARNSDAKVCGEASRVWEEGGKEIMIPASGHCFEMPLPFIAHELAHGFGLRHDFRDSRYVLSYGRNRDRISKCAAEWLDVSPFFNTRHNPSVFDAPTTIQMLPPQGSSPNAIRIRFEVSDPDRLHQAQLLIPTTAADPAPYLKLHSCKSLSTQSSTIEFIITELTGDATTEVTLHTVDVNGNITRSESFPIDITTLLPSIVVSIPDANLAAAVRSSIGLAPDDAITSHAMRRLTRLDAPNRQIRNLTGLEHATNLGRLYLLGNAISDISVLSGLIQLSRLDLARNAISDVSALSGLTRLDRLYLSNNTISDISALSGLTQLTYLVLTRNAISDVSPLISLNLTGKNSGKNSDSIGLYLEGNPLSYASIHMHIPAMQAKGIEVKFHNVAHPALLKTSGDLQEGTPGEALATPFVIQVVDAHGKPRRGVSVKFAVTAGDGHLSATIATSDATGKAQTALTLGSRLGKQIVTATATAFTPLVVTFTAYATANPTDRIVSNNRALHISEIMVASNKSRLPQWIELYNPSDTHSVDLKGWALEIQNRRSDNLNRNVTFTFKDKSIEPQETVLIVSKQGRSSNHFRNEQIYNLSTLHPKLQDMVLSKEGFYLELSNAAGELIDEAGNLDDKSNTDNELAWTLPKSLTENGNRSSMIRRYNDEVPRLGTEEFGWISAENTKLLTGTTIYYGHPKDIGAPGVKSGGALPVTLSHFRAERTDAGVVLKWTTESELDNAGFYILRSETKNGTFKAINPTLIQGAGTTSERNTYTWTDTTAKPNTVYYYQIEDISHAGVRKQLATVRMRGFVSASGKLTTRWADLKVQN